MAIASAPRAPPPPHLRLATPASMVVKAGYSRGRSNHERRRCLDSGGVEIFEDRVANIVEHSEVVPRVGPRHHRELEAAGTEPRQDHRHRWGCEHELRALGCLLEDR